MTALTARLIFSVISLLFFGGCVYSLHAAGTSLRQREQYKLFWHIPYALGLFITAAATMALVFFPMTTDGSLRVSEEMRRATGDVVKVGSLIYLFGITLWRIAPKGQLLVDRHSLWACIGAAAMVAWYFGAVPTWLRHTPYVGFFFALIMFNARKPENIVAGNHSFRMRTRQRPSR